MFINKILTKQYQITLKTATHLISCEWIVYLNMFKRLIFQVFFIISLQSADPLNCNIECKGRHLCINKMILKNVNVTCSKYALGCNNEQRVLFFLLAAIQTNLCHVFMGIAWAFKHMIHHIWLHVFFSWLCMFWYNSYKQQPRTLSC